MPKGVDCFFYWGLLKQKVGVIRKNVTYSELLLTTDCFGFTTYNLVKVILILLFIHNNTTIISYENSCC